MRSKVTIKKILFVDDDAKILAAIERQFDDDYDIDTALGPLEGIKAVQERGPFAVVISDMRMPEMTGVEMLSEIKAIAPDTVRMMLTGFADLETTIEAINRGNIFRFLSKPCPNDILELAIKDGIRQYELIRAEHELVEGTLMGSVKVLSEVLGLVNPVAFGRAARVKRIAMKIADEMQVAKSWEIEIASMLSTIGCVTLPQQVLESLTHGKPLPPEQQAEYERHPATAKRLLESIPRLENVAEIVAYQETQFDGGGFPAGGPSGQDLPMGARILKVALDYDVHDGVLNNSAKSILALQENSARYDPIVLDAWAAVVAGLNESPPLELRLGELAVGMVFAENVESIAGNLLVAKGHEVTESALKLLRNFGDSGNLSEPLKVARDHPAPQLTSS